MSDVKVYGFRKWYAFSKLNFITEIEEMYLNVILGSSLVVQLLALGAVTGWETKDPTSCTVWPKKKSPITEECADLTFSFSFSFAYCCYGAAFVSCNNRGGL